MTYMPAFIQTATEISRTDQQALEADILGERSRQCLSQLLNSLDSNAPPESVYTTRLDAELQIVENKGYSGYFLIVADYVQWARDNGIAVGPGRGSGPCSLIGFVLGITKVDPIKYNLPFERFVNPDRNSHADFDLDFCDERRDEVTAYLQSKYGSDRVAQLSSETNIPLASRLVICDRPLAKVIPLHAETGTSLPTAKITTAQVTAAGLVQFKLSIKKRLR